MMPPKRAAPAAPVPANLSAAQMRAALPLIRRRIEEVTNFDADIAPRGSPEVTALQARIDELLVDTFGSGSVEYGRYSAAAQLDCAPYIMGGTPEHLVIEGFQRGKQTSLALLTEIARSFTEKLDIAAGGDAGGRAIRAYEGLDLHNEIARAVGDLYRNGHYANAVVDAVTVLNNLVRMRSGLSEDGSKLMDRAFSASNPVLAFNDLADESDRDEQVGFMMMFKGAVAGLRNPRAHKLIKDDPERALEFIAYISLLAKLVDSARRVPTKT